MRLLAFLASTRLEAGTLHASEGDQVVFGPVRARPYGDHPAGLYRITGVVDVAGVGRETYDPWFIALDPLEGEALAAKRAGQTGLGIHAGESLGCLRLDEASMAELVPLLRAQLAGDKVVLYDCRVIRERA